MLRETSALPSCTQCDDVSLCPGTIIGSNSVDFRVECFNMTPFGCRVMRTSRAIMCVSTETRKNVTSHRGQSQNKQSGFERTCPTCVAAARLQHWALLLSTYAYQTDFRPTKHMLILTGCPGCPSQPPHQGTANCLTGLTLTLDLLWEIAKLRGRRCSVLMYSC